MTYTIFLIVFRCRTGTKKRVPEDTLSCAAWGSVKWDFDYMTSRFYLFDLLQQSPFVIVLRFARAEAEIHKYLIRLQIRAVGVRRLPFTFSRQTIRIYFGEFFRRDFHNFRFCHRNNGYYRGFVKIVIFYEKSKIYHLYFARNASYRLWSCIFSLPLICSNMRRGLPLMFVSQRYNSSTALFFMISGMSLEISEFMPLT